MVLATYSCLSWESEVFVFISRWTSDLGEQRRQKCCSLFIQWCLTPSLSSYFNYHPLISFHVWPNSKPWVPWEQELLSYDCFMDSEHLIKGLSVCSRSEYLLGKGKKKKERMASFLLISHFFSTGVFKIEAYFFYNKIPGYYINRWMSFGRCMHLCPLPAFQTAKGEISFFS